MHSRRTKNKKTDGIEQYIIEVMCLRLKEKEALSYLSERGYHIGRTEYYAIKQEIKENTQQRLSLIASEEFSSQHLLRLDTLKTIESELWSNYHAETNPTKRANILMQITEVQQVLATFYDSTQYVLQQSAIIRKKKKVEQQGT